jgi:hypothetical protein
MPNEIQPTHPDRDATDPEQHRASTALWRRLLSGAWRHLRQWSESTGAALERAEKRIMENFRVPPNGG